LALTSPTSAKYLHLGDAQVGAGQLAGIEAERSTYVVSVGSCWHAGAHVVQCSFTENARVSGILKEVAVIALRGDNMYGHLLGGGVSGVVERPRFLCRLGG
jgi:hypothetical protein